MAYRPVEDEYFELVYDAGEGLFVLRTAPTLDEAKRIKQEYIDKQDIWPAICRKRPPKEIRKYGNIRSTDRPQSRYHTRKNYYREGQK